MTDAQALKPALCSGNLVQKSMHAKCQEKIIEYVKEGRVNYAEKIGDVKYNPGRDAELIAAEKGEQDLDVFIPFYLSV